jgi:uncharacterized SAM-dependent methyltransferase
VLRILHPCANLGCWLALVIAVPEVVDACAASTLLVLGSGGDSSNLRCLDACEHVYMPLDLVKNMLYVQPLALVHAALD